MAKPKPTTIQSAKRPKARPSKPAGTEVRLTTTGLHETDNTFYPGGNMSGIYRDRYDYDRQTVFGECLRAWRVSPLARRIVKLMSMFIIGDGISIQSDDPATHAYLQSWWKHDLNKLHLKCVDLCDEATRSGNIFPLCTVDRSTGMLYVRFVPADQIGEINTAGNDIEQELDYIPVDKSRKPWTAYDHTLTQINFMLHYTYNKPIGTSWGEPDLAPMLPWIGRYSSWLEDRARINRFRQSFVYVLQGEFIDEPARAAREREVNAHPPVPGSILVTNKNETWSVMAPQLASHEASEDGLALKKMVSLGAGFPTHYLAEPESSTRTTAEAAGTPTFRGLEQTQKNFLDMLTELAAIAVKQRARVSADVKPTSEIKAVGPDITERDNSSLSLAVSRIYPAVSELFDREGIDEDELLRLVYRMAGEQTPKKAPVAMKRRPLKPQSAQPITSSNSTTEQGVNPADKPPKET
jgi:hypothetical protein